MKLEGARNWQVHKELVIFSAINSYTTFFSNLTYAGVLKCGELRVMADDRLCAEAQRRVDHQVGAQVRVGGGVAVEAMAGVGLTHERHRGVGVAEHHHGRHREVAAGADDAALDLAAVGDEQGVDAGHGDHIRNTP